MKLATRLRRGRRRARWEHLAWVHHEWVVRQSPRTLQLQFFEMAARQFEEQVRTRGPDGNDRLGRYILIDGEPYRINENEGLGWAAWMECREDQRIVKQTPSRDTKMLVSTVFLGLTPGIFDDIRPWLWETMVFGESEDTEWHPYQRRYTSREAALAGHDEIVDQVDNGIILVLGEDLKV